MSNIYVKFKKKKQIFKKTIRHHAHLCVNEEHFGPPQISKLLL